MFSVGLLATSCLRILSTIDGLIAASAQAEGCPHCGGRLDAASYGRKTRGLCEDDGPPGRQKRWSWCCARCRKRLTPASLLFLGRRVYASITIAAIECTQRRSASERQLREESGCSAQSVARWRASLDAIWQSPLGRAIAHLFPLSAEDRRSAARLFSCWSGPWPYLAARWHLIIHPVTGGRHWPPRGAYHPLNPQKMGFDSHLRALQDGGSTF